MTETFLERLRHLDLGSFAKARLLVAGDFMLDEYIWGKVGRISPEAPVVVVQVSRETRTLGGAGNVVNNLAALGAKVEVIGLVGDDHPGRLLQDELLRLGVEPAGLFTDAARQTTRKTRVVGLLLTNMHNDFFAPLVSGIEQVVASHGYNLLVATYHADSRKSSPPPIGRHNTDGLLVFADTLKDEDLARLHVRGLPIVLVHKTPLDSQKVPSITVENKSATQRLVEHLIVKHKKKKILFLSGSIHQEDSYWRETGYRSALEAHGIPFDERLVLVGEFDRDVAYKSLSEFLSRRKKIIFDAIFASKNA